MQEGDIVLGTVKEVTNTITSVILEDGSEGTIISSEIAPGRIKHMRQYVTPNKKIVCKVLEISGNNIHLSLRRVTAKERGEILKGYKMEHAAETALKQVLAKDADETINKIRRDHGSLNTFASLVKSDSDLLEKYIPADKIEAVQKIIIKKRKNSSLKYTLNLTCPDQGGLEKIKSVCKLDNDNASITYLSAGKFSLKLAVDDFKAGKKEATVLLEGLQQAAKKNHCEFSFNEEK